MPSVKDLMFQCLARYKLYTLMLVSVTIFWAIDTNIRPYLLKLVVDVLSNKNVIIDDIYLPLLGYISLGVFAVIIFRFYDYGWLILLPDTKKFLADKLTKTMMLHPHDVFQNNLAGSISNHIKNITNDIPSMIKIIVDHFISLFFVITLAIITFSAVSVKFSIILALWLTSFYSGIMILSKHGSKLSAKSAEAQSNLFGHIVDIIGNMLNVRLFDGYNNESKNIKNSADHLVKAERKKDKYFMYLYAFQGISFVIYEILCVVFLVLGYKKGIVEVGDFILILSINYNLISLLWELSNQINLFVEHHGNCTQAIKLIYDNHNKLNDKSYKASANLNKTNNDIIFEKVKFHYKTNLALFNNLSIQIPHGQKVALVGYSGSGKSTFVSLILKLHQYHSGRIEIGGQNVNNITHADISSLIAFIPQTPQLFHRSIRDNISYGKFDASDEEVIEAAKKAHIHDFIMTLPEKYQTMAGERGMKLSGGQCQRIAIARAAIKNAPILILDEATSQLDSIIETEIQASVHRLIKHKTTIVVAHRLSTILSMDRILVFDKGKIVQDGTHETLSAQKNGLYHKLWNSQIGGFIPENKGKVVI